MATLRNEWGDQNKLGRMDAESAMSDAAQTGNLPQLVRKIRDAAADTSGYGAGFLFAIGERAAA